MFVSECCFDLCHGASRFLASLLSVSSYLLFSDEQLHLSCKAAVFYKPLQLTAVTVHQILQKVLVYGGPRLEWVKLSVFGNEPCKKITIFSGAWVDVDNPSITTAGALVTRLFRQF